MIREVSIDDSDLLYEWRNAPEVQEFSRQQSSISKEPHLKWLNERLNQLPDQPFWIFEIGHEVVGITRLDLDPMFRHFEISITVNPLLRGKGFGRKILNLSIDLAKSRFPGTDFYAETHKLNNTSRMLFLNSGFKLIESKGDFLVFKRIENPN